MEKLRGNQSQEALGMDHSKHRKQKYKGPEACKHRALRKARARSQCPCSGQPTRVVHSLLSDHEASLLFHSGLHPLAQRKHGAKGRWPQGLRERHSAPQ